MKKNIILVAYAVKPNSGSETALGWNTFLSLSLQHNVWLITESEFRREILDAVKRYNLDSSRITFIDIGDKARQMCWNQGDWRFYLYYRGWQKDALNAAKFIDRSHAIDVFHHLNMIGFREPGFLSTHKPNKTVLGPLGGFGNPSLILLVVNHVSILKIFKELVKLCLNFLSLFLPHARKSIRSAGCLISATPEACNYLNWFFNKDSTFIPETGCSAQLEYPIVLPEKKFFLMIAKNQPRKGLVIGIKAFLKANVDCDLVVLGLSKDGFSYFKADKNIERVFFMGKVSHQYVQEKLSACSGLIFPSLHEGTSHAVVEALAYGAPVICFNNFSHGYLVSQYEGYTVDMNFLNKLNAVNIFSVLIKECFNSNEELSERRKRSKKFRLQNSWSKKAESYSHIYDSL